MDGAGWYYRHGETAVGPVSRQRLAELEAEGTIQESTPVRRDDDDNWTALSEAFGVVADDEPPPLPNGRPDAALDSGEAAGHATEARSDLPAGSEGPIAVDDWSPEPVGPWRRFGARYIDTSVNIYLVSGLVGYVGFTLAPRSTERALAWLSAHETLSTFGTRVLAPVCVTMLAGVLNGLLMGTAGTTLGKWLFGVRVLDRDLRPLGALVAWRRELDVWVRGLGFGIPLVTIIVNLIAWRRLVKARTTVWDEGRFVVLHRPAGKGRILTALGVVVFVAIYVTARYLDNP